MISCCGENICDDFDSFYCQLLKLMPENEICKDGNFYVLLKSVARVFYDTLYSSDNPSGLCNLEKEFDPLTADMTIDIWAQLYGVSECITCGGIDEDLYPEEYKAHMTSLVKAYEMLDFYGGTDYELLYDLANMFGLTIDTKVPTLLYDGIKPNANCEIVYDFDVDCHCESGRYFQHTGAMMVMPATCKPHKKKVAIIINNAPEGIYIDSADGCDLLEEEIFCNPFVESFKCMARKIMPFGVGIKFCENWQDNPVNPLPE